MNIFSTLHDRIFFWKREYVYWDLEPSRIYVIVTNRSDNLIRQESSRNVLFGSEIFIHCDLARIESLEPWMQGNGAHNAYGSYWHAKIVHRDHSASAVKYSLTLHWPSNSFNVYHEIAFEVFASFSLVSTTTETTPVRVEQDELMQHLRLLMINAEDSLADMPIGLPSKS